MRDKTHVKTLSEKEWHSLLKEYHLSPETLKVYSRRKQFTPWCERAGMNQVQIEEFKNALTESPSYLFDVFFSVPEKKQSFVLYVAV
jgi:hypothetical protein